MAGLRALTARTYMQAGTGILVNKGTAYTDPQNVWTTIFTIANGLVLVTNLVGVRTVVQAGGASFIQLRHSVGTTALCAATTLITADAVATIYTITGNPSDGVISGASGAPIQGGMHGSPAGLSSEMFGVIMMAGNIQYTCTAAAGTGSTRFILTYIPLDPAAIVTAA